MTDAKTLKKRAKAAAKLAKKRAPHEIDGSPATAVPQSDPSPSIRSANAAEQQVRLTRLRVICALASAIIALATLVVILLRSQ